ncbi:Hypothetical protein FKW44_009335 [Caligus rogercresseyi]|uniref:Uncharacterized protein n=1 Tax=Caligus rogercresseyi TaxID=217165 RepID=A0A7T8HF59_CALRO|nr:Hypothetical protein FKW44_009335 [Caligus rogercresseyi]
MLGAKFDSTLSLNLNVDIMARAARVRANMVVRLAKHIPRGPYLHQLAKGIVLGKLGYAVSAVTPVRFGGSNPTGPLAAAQVALNDVARTLTGSLRREHIPVRDLLKSAGLPSINTMAVRSAAMEAWKAFWSRDGEEGGRNPLGLMLFEKKNGKETRSDAAGIADTLVCAARTAWNKSPQLRQARTWRAARDAAIALAEGVAL